MPDDANATAIPLSEVDWLHSTTVATVIEQAATIMLRTGFDRRIDIYRDVVLDDAVTLAAFGRSHPVRVRVKITACSMLWPGAQKEG
jgi:hypothetical protein